MELNHTPGIAYGDYNVGKEMWSSIKPFTYQLPDLTSILSKQWRSVAALATWLLGLFFIASIFSNSISKI